MKRFGTIMMAALLSMGAIRLAAAAPESQAPSVRVEEVSTLDRSEPKTYVGTIGASDTVDIVARVSGTLEQRPFKEGSMVKKGDLLVQFDKKAAEAEGYDMTIAVLVTNTQEFLDVIPAKTGEIKEQETLFTIV